jgi:hypothetical protein
MSAGVSDPMCSRLPAIRAPIASKSCRHVARAVYADTAGHRRTLCSATWFGIHRRGGSTILHHRHIRAVLIRDWSQPMDGIGAAIWASSTTDLARANLGVTDSCDPTPAGAGSGTDSADDTLRIAIAS